ncbi:DUF2284 domain-containing protein [Pontiellaceae bacterium B12227]|nr:DUF2284 domain-containing protein [Pontiellaceae bacterium B12227]
MMKPPVFKIKEVTQSELLKAYKPSEILGYCAHCGNHDSVWSCPPHRFDPAEFIEGYSFAYVVSGAVSMCGFEEQADAVIHYYEMRSKINQALLAFETTVPGGVSLYAGHCDACKPCSRTQGEECVYPDLCRYSLESLGLDVEMLIETHFGESLQWVAGKMPKQMLVVPALLSPVEVDIPSFIQALETGVVGAA